MALLITKIIQLHLHLLLLLPLPFFFEMTRATTTINPSPPGPGGATPIQPFRLDQVRLGPGVFQEKRDRIKRFLREYDERRFLVLFNAQAGRTSHMPAGVSPPGGWEDGGLLSGHWTGHFLTALSQAYADQREDVFKTKLDWMVAGLAACQDAITARMVDDGGKVKGAAAAWTPTHPGYLGALPEDTVLRLGPPRWAVYGGNASTNTWAPWYTQHKIMRGLLDAYHHANSSLALQVATRMADWAHLALTVGDKNHPKYSGENLTRSDLNYMWDLYIGGEFGGANEVFAEMYALTRDARHLQTAKAFDNRESLFDAAVRDEDILVVPRQRGIPGRRRAERLHANTHVPQFLGYLRIYEHGGEESEYLAAAKNFYGWVVPHRLFASGGTGGNFPGHTDNPELFQNRGNIANAIAERNGAETCTTYNLLKLARNLFLHEHDPAYMDDYERGLYNMIAGSRADTDGISDPQLTYFQPHTPGARREYGNTGTCCGGTGLERHTKYQETVYLRSADGSTLWINLYVPSTLTWAERGFSVTQKTAFPRGDSVELTVSGSGRQNLDIKLRVPAWLRAGSFQVSIDGAAQPDLDASAKPGTYLTISRRSWKATTTTTTTTINVHMPFRIRIERALDRPDTQAIMYGPLLLQLVGAPPSGRDGGGGSYWELSLYQHLKLDGDYGRAAIVKQEEAGNNNNNNLNPGFFTVAAGNTRVGVRPYYISDSQPVSSYFRRVEPRVVFGSLDAGVANRKRNDGLPRYDVPVVGIPSPGTDGLTFLDVVWDRVPFATHAAFVEAVAAVADAFVKSGVYSARERDVIVYKAGEAERELTPARCCSYLGG